MSIENELKNYEYCKITFIYAGYDPSPDQTIKVAHLKKEVIVLESDKEYLAYDIFEKEAKLEKLQAKVNILNNSITLNLSFWKKERSN